MQFKQVLDYKVLKLAKGALIAVGGDVLERLLIKVVFRLPSLNSSALLYCSDFVCELIEPAAKVPAAGFNFASGR